MLTGLTVPTSRLAAVVAGAVVALTVVGVAARATYGARTSADEPQYLLTALSLGEDGDLDISDELATRAYEPFHEITVDPQTYELADGRQVSPHDPLLPLLLALPMRVAGWVGAKLMLVAIAALTAALTASAAIRGWGVRPVTAGVTTVAAFGGLPLAGYASQVYPEMPAAAAVAVVLLAFGTGTTSPSWRSIAAVLAVVIALPWLAIKYVPVAAVAGLAVLWRCRRDRARVAAVMSVAIGAGVLYALAHQRWYGGWTVYATGDHFVDDGEFSVVGTEVDLLGRTRRIIGLLVDRQFGIAAWAPLWFLLPVAVTASARRRDRRLLLGVLAAAWATATFIALTMHGWWVPGRQLVVGLPAAVVLLAAWIDDGAGPWRRRIVGGLGALGIVNWLWLAVEASTGRRTLIVDFAETGALPYRVLAPILPDGLRASSADDVWLAVWTALVIIVAAVVGRRSQAAEPT